jgi:hypothetical protein
LNPIAGLPLKLAGVPDEGVNTDIKLVMWIRKLLVAWIARFAIIPTGLVIGVLFRQRKYGIISRGMMPGPQLHQIGAHSEKGR